MRPIIPTRVSAISPPQIDVVNARAAAWRERGADVISLGQAIPGFSPPSVALQAVRETLSDADTHIYSADAGLLPLRQALCQRLSTHYGVDADPGSEVIITAGANQAFLLALLTFLEPGDEVLLPSPYFMNHEMAVRIAGGIPIEVPLSEATGFALHLADVEPYLSPRTRAIVIVSPNNPTGAVYRWEELTSLAQTLIPHGIVIITDETYMHFVYDGECHFSLASLPMWRNGVITLGSFSKCFGMTGWRVGYMIAPKEFTSEALKIQDAMVICAPVISQKAVLSAVSQAWDHSFQFNEELKARRRYLSERLQAIPALHWHPTQGGFFAFVRVSGCRDAQQLAMDILDQVHVVSIPGNLFGRMGEGFLRLSYGSVDLRGLEESFDRLARFFSQFYRTQGS